MDFPFPKPAPPSAVQLGNQRGPQWRKQWQFLLGAFHVVCAFFFVCFVLFLPVEAVFAALYFPEYSIWQINAAIWTSLLTAIVFSQRVRAWFLEARHLCFPWEKNLKKAARAFAVLAALATLTSVAVYQPLKEMLSKQIQDSSSFQQYRDRATVYAYLQALEDKENGLERSLQLAASSKREKDAPLSFLPLTKEDEPFIGIHKAMDYEKGHQKRFQETAELIRRMNDTLSRYIRAVVLAIVVCSFLSAALAFLSEFALAQPGRS